MTKRDFATESLALHYEKKGKIRIIPNVPVTTSDDLSLAYTPGVAQPCLEIEKDVIEKNIRVMDQTAITLAKENNMPIIVFSIKEAGNFEKVLSGEGRCSIIS